jgi:4a-hydroxytetrahydrobiopterin dehydratase
VTDTDPKQTLRYSQVQAEEGLDDWRFFLTRLHARFRTGSFVKGLELVTRITEAAEAADHHPDVDLRYPGTVRVVLTTHATGSVTTADADLARTVSALAAAAGAVARPDRAESAELGIDAMDIDAVRPFWAAVLGYRDVSGNLVDPLGRGPAVWFQQMDVPRPQRNRIHVDVTVAHDVAERRVAAALAAGGTLVSDARARAWWVLADPEGNEACVCTWQDRD